MSTWHQDRNPDALSALWRPDPVKWKCVSDRHRRPAGCTTFDNEADARAYAKRTGDIVIAPLSVNVPMFGLDAARMKDFLAVKNGEVSIQDLMANRLKKGTTE